MHTVCVIAFDRISVFEMAVACEVFGIDRSEMGLPNYRLMVCGLEEPPLRASAGFLLHPQHRLDVLDEADTVIMPGWRDIAERPPEQLLAGLRRAYGRGARIASVCSGAFALAAAGLLDGRRATTHWMYTQRLAREYPDVDVDASVLYVDAGDGIYTSAGTAAGVDLCLHLVRLDHGAHVANMFARRMVVHPHRDGGQAQFVETPMPVTPADDRLAATLGWALEHIDQPMTVDQLAARASMSPRTFARRFLAATGSTPLRWLLLQRVAAAQRMLETAELSVEEITERCGFGSAAAFRLHFGRHVGTSPTAYRAAFRHAELSEAV